MEDQQLCAHIESLETILQPKVRACEECTRTGSRWVHLRTCKTCGATLCCDDSPNTHMTRHYLETSHPVIISAEPGEKWMWCFKDEVFARYD